jgi:hypothetical protein
MVHADEERPMEPVRMSAASSPHLAPIARAAGLTSGHMAALIATLGE